MKIAFSKIFLKVIILTTIFSVLYFFFYLIPKAKEIKKRKELTNFLIPYKNILVQNRIAYIQLTKLDPRNPKFNNQKSNLVSILKEEGLKKFENLEKENQNLPEVKGVSEKIPPLLTKTKDTLLELEKLLQKVFETKTYEEGLKILKSDEAVKLLTRQTNLIIEFDSLIKQLNSY